MSNELAVQSSTNTDLIDFDDSKLALIKRQIAPTATPDELDLFLHQCRRTGLDPLAKQIYFMKYGGKMAIITGIDGYRLIAMRTGKHSGTDDAIFAGRQNYKNKTVPSKASVTVYRNVGSQRVGFTASAYWDEFCPSNGGQWLKMPHVMLAKVAEAAALRKAFPADLSGMYTSDEMDQAVVSNAPQVTRRSSIDEETGVIDGEFDGYDYEETEPPSVPDEFDTAPDDVPMEETARTAVDIAAALIAASAGNDGKPSDKMLSKMQKDLAKTCGSNGNAKTFLKSVFNVDSSTECTFGQVKALLDWVGSTAPDWTISPVAIAEAKTILDNPATM